MVKLQIVEGSVPAGLDREVQEIPEPHLHVEDFCVPSPLYCRTRVGSGWRTDRDPLCYGSTGPTGTGSTWRRRVTRVSSGRRPAGPSPASAGPETTRRRTGRGRGGRPSHTSESRPAVPPSRQGAGTGILQGCDPEPRSKDFRIEGQSSQERRGFRTLRPTVGSI